MQYAIIRTQKHKSIQSLKSRMNHTLRTQPTPNADPKKLHKNQLLFGKTDYAKSCETKIEDYSKTHNVRKNATFAIEYLMSASPEFFDTGTFLEKEKRLKEWYAAQVDFLKSKHGAQNILCIYLHLDEKTPHLEAFILPIDKKGKLNASEFLDGRKKLGALQTEYANHNKKFGLSRGLEGSTATHQDVKKFYSMISQTADINSDDVRKSLEFDKPTAMDRLKIDEYVEKQQKKIAANVVNLFKPVVYKSKLVESAEKLTQKKNREDKEMARREYKYQKEIEALKLEAEKNIKQLVLLESAHEDVKYWKQKAMSFEAELKLLKPKKKPEMVLTPK